MALSLSRYRLRLRHKLALSLSLAALLPVAVAATVAVRVVLRSLEIGLREQTTRQLRIGMNLVLRNVERLGGDAVQLAAVPALVDSIAMGDDFVDDLIARQAGHLQSSLVQIADEHGRVVATRATGGHPERYHGLAVESTSDLIQRGLAYERRVDVQAVGDQLVIRAVAPIVDPAFGLHGVVVMSLPLDGDFADGIKGALGGDVLIHAGDGPARSSFLDELGGRLAGISAPPEVAEAVLKGGTRFTRALIDGREYAMGYAPLKNLEGRHVGMLAVAVGRGSLVRAKVAAARSLALGAAGAFLFALALTGILSRRLTRPIARLHEGALAVARGELDVRIAPLDTAAGDEIGDLSKAFATMTSSLRENQDRLAARMREIVALHDAGRAVSSVLGLVDVLRKIVDSVARVLDAQLAVLWLVEPGSPRAEPRLRIGAARAKMDRASLMRTLGGVDAEKMAAPLEPIALDIARNRDPLRLDLLRESPEWADAAQKAQVSGPMLAIPLERKGHVVGVLVVGRHELSEPFTDADENLIGTFADQAATAIENARLYEEVRAFSEELEEKVRLRTAELTAINAELGRALTELRETQSQLLLSERMAGLGALVAGVAHEINSPSAAIRGSVDAMGDNVERLTRRARQLGEIYPSEEERRAFLDVVEHIAAQLAEARVGSPAEVRRRARDLAPRLAEAGVEGADLAARTLAEIGADRAIEQLMPLLSGKAADVPVGYLQEYAYLHRNTAAIRGAIKQIQRIVGALKSYSHLDQAKVEPTDLHEGIENTLVILHHELKYGITIVRKYGQLPKIPVFVDELNQVWTNLIHNAVQALSGKGEIVIESLPPSEGGDNVAIKVIDNGPGITSDILPRIFEPFFTTKAKGEGTGLGLGIVKKIVEKHGGSVTVASEPGKTCFTVTLPLAGPKVLAANPQPAPAAVVQGGGGGG